MATLKEKDKICAVCLTQFANYTCPRCNIQYCSLTCYRSQKHLQCSESFYRDNVVSELQQKQLCGEDNGKVMEMLKRLEEGDDSLLAECCDDEGLESTDASTLEERLAGLDLDKDEDQVWERLTVSERKEFHRMAREGALSQLLPESQLPWWKVVVEPLNQDRTNAIPSPPANIPPLSSLVKDGSVSPYICYNILNVLYSYAYTVRLYNMSHHDLPKEASQTLLDISSCLSTNAWFDSVGTALHVAMDTVCKNPGIFNSRDFSVAILDDVKAILCSKRSSRCHVSSAMADMHQLLGSARSSIRAEKDFKSSVAMGASSKKLWLARKKAHFLLAWVILPENACRCVELSVLVGIEYEQELAGLQEEAIEMSTCEATVLAKRSVPSPTHGDNIHQQENRIREMD